MDSIFKPRKSVVQKGMAGKSVLLYGGNSTGKTLNCVQAKKALLVAFELGINAINDVTYVQPKKWAEWKKIVNDLTSDATIKEAKEMYDTVIIDSIEPMFRQAEDFICTSFDVPSVGRDSDGKMSRGGVWKEFRAAIEEQNRKLLGAGYTLIFIAHEGTRDMYDDRGNQYTKIYPRGDKASVDYLCDNCDFIAYARNQAPDENGNEILSTLYFRPTMAFHARTRFKYMVSSIPEWNIEKLNAAIAEAVKKEEDATGKVGQTFEERKAQEVKEAKAEAENKEPIQNIIDKIGEKVRNMIIKDGSKTAYEDILEETVNNRAFKCQDATEKQRSHLELILAALEKKGY